MNKIGIILLAAGASTRYGNFPKQLLKFNNKTLILHSAEHALASSAELVCVVLGANYELVKDEISQSSAEIIINKDWENGMSSSIKCGLKQLLKIEPNLTAVFIQLCDQPLITSQIIDSMIKIYLETDKRIIAAKYNDTFGVPALFGHLMFDELLNLKDQIGAKKVIEKFFGETEFVEIPEAIFDIDTPENYESLIGSKSHIDLI